MTIDGAPDPVLALRSFYEQAPRAGPIRPSAPCDAKLQESASFLSLERSERFPEVVHARTAAAGR